MHVLTVILVAIQFCRLATGDSQCTVQGFPASDNIPLGTLNQGAAEPPLAVSLDNQIPDRSCSGEVSGSTPFAPPAKGGSKHRFPEPSGDEIGPPILLENEAKMTMPGAEVPDRYRGGASSLPPPQIPPPKYEDV